MPRYWFPAFVNGIRATSGPMWDQVGRWVCPDGQHRQRLCMPTSVFFVFEIRDFFRFWNPGFFSFLRCEFFSKNFAEFTNSLNFSQKICFKCVETWIGSSVVPAVFVHLYRNRNRIQKNYRISGIPEPDIRSFPSDRPPNGPPGEGEIGVPPPIILKK